VQGGWRAWLARRLGRADLVFAGEAEVVAMSLRDEPQAAAAVQTAAADAAGAADAHADATRAPCAAHWLATPVAFAAAMDHVRLPQDGLLELDVATRAALAADFGRVLGGGELILQPVAADAFLLRGLDAVGAVTCDPARALGTDIGAALPSGPGSRPLRALMAEIEMWLHEHPVNRGRSARGLPLVSNLWLWGGGAVPAEETVRCDARPDALIASGDAWVTAVARLSGAMLCAPVTELENLLSNPADLGIAVLPRTAPQFESRWLEPAVAALRRGALREICLLGNDRAVALRAADRLRFWRPSRGWLAALH
jgi:hypothetical protein